MPFLESRSPGDRRGGQARVPWRPGIAKVSHHPTHHPRPDPRFAKLSSASSGSAGRRIARSNELRRLEAPSCRRLVSSSLSEASRRGFFWATRLAAAHASSRSDHVHVRGHHAHDRWFTLQGVIGIIVTQESPTAMKGSLGILGTDRILWPILLLFDLRDPLRGAGRAAAATDRPQVLSRQTFLP